VVRGFWRGVSDTSAFLLQVKRKNVLNILGVTQNLLVCCDGETRGVVKGGGEWCR